MSKLPFVPLLLMVVAAGLAPSGVRAQGFEPARVEPPGEGVYRVAVLGCLRQDQPTPALETYATMGADLAIWVGDNVYADTRDDPSFIASCYRTLASKPAFQRFRATTPFAVTWDDHDYGLNNSGKGYALRDEAKRIFREFWAMGEHIPEDRPGVYHQRLFDLGGRVLRVVLLDVRYNRDEPGVGADMLGEAQWAWLERTLAAPADITLIVSGTQVLIEPDAGWEAWSQYPRARERLFETIRRAGVERVVFITGDQHYAEVNRVRGALDFDAVEFEFAGVNQTEDAPRNPHRVSPRATSLHTAAYLDVQPADSETEPAHMLFRVLDARTGRSEILYRLNLSEVSTSLRLGGRPVFTERSAITIEHDFPSLIARYTTDGTDPTPASPAYAGPIEVDRTATVRAALFTPEGVRRSGVRSWSVRRVEPLAAAADDAGVRAGALAYRYAQGRYEVLPDMAREQVLARGMASDLDVRAIASREDHYAITYEGFVRAPATGLYEFSVRSDDGSRLTIGGREVVDNDGSHAPRTRRGLIALEAGWHPLRLDYFEDYAGELLELRWALVEGDRSAVTRGPVPFTHLGTR